MASAVHGDLPIVLLVVLASESTFNFTSSVFFS